MRPGQNKRMRGRNNNNNNNNSSNRKGPNPLTRSYESNGPDVKIRGTAHHVGEKYLQLARDAQSSGDPVMAESYLQHAEHYFRLIASAQQAQQQAAYGYQRPAGETAEADDDDGDDDFSALPDRFASPAERVVTPPPQPAPQPYVERPAYNGGNERPAYEPRQERYDRSSRQGQDSNRQGQDSQQPERPYQDRPAQSDRTEQQRPQRYDNRQDRTNQDRNNRGERQPYADRPYGDRTNQDRGTQEGAPQQQDRSGQNRDYDNRGQRNNNRGNRDFRGDNNQPRESREARQPDIEPSVNGLPAFITTPVRIQQEAPQPVIESITATVGDAPSSTPEGGSDNGEFALRPRRRRRTKAEFAGSEGDVAHDTPAPDPVGE
jgi:hypothetical protein